MEITQERLNYLESNLYNVDFKSGDKLVKCKIEILEAMLLITDGVGKKYIVDSDSIEKISAFKEYTQGPSMPRTRKTREKIK